MTRVLVAVASKYGATHEIAEAIGRALTDRGLSADVMPAAEVENVEDATPSSLAARSTPAIG